MCAIDRWVIKNAFKFIADSILKLDELGAFSINLSGNSLTEPDFMEYVLEQFNETRLPTSRICFEITETSAIGSLDDAIEFMGKKTIAEYVEDEEILEILREIGVDFAQVYGSRRKMPIDELLAQLCSRAAV